MEIEDEAIKVHCMCCHIGQQIKKLRTKRKLYQYQLGKLTGIHQTHISEIERTGRVSVVTLARRLVALDAKICFE